ncbi:thioredoxin family protein [Shewanella aegiceratis]|uniref:thioredoxin family protein n=1 Tax=Shewanella aegiceratis TaxID=2864203 RepID=UPI001C65C5FC|nr:thioredoxin family protein [Shewanella aegiceratis]QYJ82908.1 TM0996/MTH895 family glutaredoxin-like protein [Shewanella aegiceratis]
MKIEVLGSGCKRCTNLASDIARIADELSLNIELTKVTDMTQIAAYGVMSTPAIVIDGEVLAAGRLPSEEELAQLLSKINKVQ